MNEIKDYTINQDYFKDGKKKTAEEKLEDFKEANRLRTGFGDFSDVEKYFKILLAKGEIKQIDFLKKHIKENENKIKEENLIENNEAIRAIIKGDVKLKWENNQLQVEIIQKELTKKEQQKKEEKKEEVKEQIDIITKVSINKVRKNF